MRRLVYFTAVCGLVLVTGCTSGAGSDPTAGGPLPGARVVAEYAQYGESVSVYEAGAGIDPGVYTASARCFGSAASSTHDPFAEESEDDTLLRSAGQVGDRARVEVRRGEFLHLVNGCRWEREDGSGPVTPDPATRAGACAILAGPGALAEQSVAALKRAAAGRGAGVGGVQERLMAVVFARTPVLWRPAGELVDFLDAPDYFVKDGKVVPRVTQAVTAIRTACLRR